MDKTERALRDLLAERKLVNWPNEPQWVAIWTAANAKGYTGGISAAVHRVAPELLDPEWVKMLSAEDREMMWSDFRLRRSVAPFRNTQAPFPATAIPARPDTNPIYPVTNEADLEKTTAQQALIAGLVANHWEVISDGPSGVQLRAPRKLKTLDVLSFVLGLASFALGFLTPMAYGIGLILVVLALLDYFVLSKREIKFFPPA
jgi:hypothetical protein